MLSIICVCVTDTIRYISTNRCQLILRINSQSETCFQEDVGVAIDLLLKKCIEALSPWASGMYLCVPMCDCVHACMCALNTRFQQVVLHECLVVRCDGRVHSYHTVFIKVFPKCLGSANMTLRLAEISPTTMQKSKSIFSDI